MQCCEMIRAAQPRSPRNRITCHGLKIGYTEYNLGSTVSVRVRVRVSELPRLLILITENIIIYCKISNFHSLFLFLLN